MRTPDVFHSCSYTNPQLQARVLPARSKMVTTLIAQMSDLLAPNIQIYDAHVVDLYQWVCHLLPARVCAGLG
jgi:hypothetical protein